MPENVVVLVIDDFGEMAVDGRVKLRCDPDPCRDPKIYGNCVVRPDGQTYATSGVSTGGGNKPHGDLVYVDLKDELARKMGNPAVSNQYGYKAWGINWIREITSWDTIQNDEVKDNLLLVAVDIEGFKTSIIADRIQQALDLFKKMGFKKFVLNMSFAIVPCKFVTAYEEVLKTKDVAAIKDILDTLTGVPDSAQLAQAIANGTISPIALANRLLVSDIYPLIQPINEKVYWTDDLKMNFLVNDPLRNWLTTCNHPSVQEVIPVGAAGNHGEKGYQYPFAPAIFDSVVSVGAVGEENLTEENSTGRKAYSNPSEVLMSGDHGTDKDETNRPLTGTSFAAPKFSARAAIYFWNGGTVPNPSGLVGGTNRTRPPLGYADDEGPWKNQRYQNIRGNAAIGGNSSLWEDW